MSLQLVTDQGTLKIPGTTVSASVQATAAGLGTTGVVAIVGEATQGLDYASETDLTEDCSFGPDQEADIRAKYGAGPLVDGFVACTAPANDPEIQGAPARIVLIKTNSGLFATGALAAYSGTWGTLRALAAGASGNLYSRTVTAAATEVVPTTASFTFLPPIAQTDINFRVNGGAAVTYSITVGQLPSAFVTGVAALAGVLATGGADRGIVTVSGTLALAVVSGNAVTVTRSVAWAVTPSVGDTLYISATSVIKGGSDQNVGAYVVTAATSTTISATKLLDASGTPNQVTAPVAVSAQSIVSTTADARAFAPVTVTLEAGDPLAGVGKTLEIAELTSSSGRLSYLAYALSTTAVTWVSTSAAPTALTSSTEHRAKINIARASDSVSEDLESGGEILLKVRYTGTTATATVAAGVLTIAVTGGAGTSPAAITLSAFATIGDLAAYLDSLIGFDAAVGSVSISTRPATDLDAGVFGICSTFGALVGRLKGDAAKLVALIGASGNVRISGTAPTTGLPAPAATAFLAGGAKGATTDAIVANALDALESVDCNFVATAFSCDAATDIADGLTDSASTYTIAAVNANLRSHVLKMNTLKQFSPRLGMASFRGTFSAARDAASNTASFLMAMTFEDVRAAGNAGIVQQRPWYGAVTAAAYQAAAFRKSIFNRGVNIVGALQAAGDFNPRKASQVENAGDSGLLTLAPLKSGGWQFVVDQTTWTANSSFFHNSIQAVYGYTIIARTLQEDMNTAIVGQSVADVGRTQILSAFRKSLDKLRDTFKLIAPSDDAPLGYLNEDARVTPPSVSLAVEVREATSLYFVQIRLSLGAVTQTG